VPASHGPRKTVEEIVSLVGEVAGSVDAIALTSGIAVSVEEEVEYVCRVIQALRSFALPIGVSIFPTPATPGRLAALGVSEVKFNLEAATPALFAALCPGLSYETVWDALEASVPLFGRGHVFSNVIIGLGETDDELDACIDRLVELGVIPVLRPLNPVAGCRGLPRPDAERLVRAARHLRSALGRAGLDPTAAQSMCGACTGCDLAAWRDL
jgi:biotin synthase-related radical SAM superfamily protein